MKGERRILWAGMIDDASLPTGEGFERALAETLDGARSALPNAPKRTLASPSIRDTPRPSERRE